LWIKGLYEKHSLPKKSWLIEPENGFMEPKYYAFRFGDWTPQSLSDMSGRVSLSSPQFWWDKMAWSEMDPYNSGELKGIKADGQPSFTDIDEIPFGKLT